MSSTCKRQFYRVIPCMLNFFYVHWHFFIWAIFLRYIFISYSRQFGFLKLRGSEHVRTRALVLKAVKYLEGMLVQVKVLIFFILQWWIFFLILCLNDITMKASSVLFTNLKVFCIFDWKILWMLKPNFIIEFFWLSLKSTLTLI